MRRSFPNSPQKIRNSSVVSGNGALGMGDRGAFSTIPINNGNPYTFQDYITRWRQYVLMYEMSWEARKIIRIPIEDALRKPWMAEDIPEQMAMGIMNKLEQMNFLNTLKKSMMLERLLGGSLTFMGLESDNDDPSKEYHPHEGARLAFCNSIPISRISRMNWNNDPLSEYYMRPDHYLINGESVHVSRCLVWDGEPLFNPNDFLLTNFLPNLAGFGPSKLATLWDDIVKAVGTRQAAYQLIQTNNSILMAVNDLQDLSGTKTGQAALRKLQDIANNISVYRAALIDGDKTTITQSAASFGSVPELIITYIQVLAAASDIPATRFLGQAPGGLNATGDSDLENYYNTIDAFQHQRIVPQLKRVYDIIGYQLYPNHWREARKKINFKFPPLWNESDKELADRTGSIVDNTLKLLDAGLMGDEKAIEELNMKNILSVKLDKDDIQIMDEFAGDADINPQEEIERLRKGSESGQQTKKTTVPISRPAFGKKPSNFGNSYDPEQVKKGLEVEREHLSMLEKDNRDDDTQLMEIVKAHLDEDEQYYTKLEKIENGKLDMWDIKWSSPDSGGSKRSMEGQYLADSKQDAESQWHKERSYLSYHECEQIVSIKKMGVLNTAQKRTQLENAFDLEPLPEPTDRQIEKGNYKKHHLRLHGLDISVENPQGSIRKGISPDGTPWESTLPAHYGYIKRTTGADGDHVDVYIGPHEDSELVFVVDQGDLGSGEFDEHKCVFGCLSSLQARELYLAGFSDGKGKDRLRAMTPMHVEQFKQWIGEGDTTKPFANSKDEGEFMKGMMNTLTALASKEQLQPIVNVMPASAPEVIVNSPDVYVQPPNVTVEAPNVDIRTQAPIVNVDKRKSNKKVKFERDADGNLLSAVVEEE